MNAEIICVQARANGGDAGMMAEVPQPSRRSTERSRERYINDRRRNGYRMSAMATRRALSGGIRRPSAPAPLPPVHGAAPRDEQFQTDSYYLRCLFVHDDDANDSRRYRRYHITGANGCGPGRRRQRRCRERTILRKTPDRHGARRAPLFTQVKGANMALVRNAFIITTPITDDYRRPACGGY